MAPSATQSAPIDESVERLDALEADVSAGRLRDALATVGHRVGLLALRSPRALAAGSAIARNVGGRSLGLRLITRARRLDRSQTNVAYAWAGWVHSMRGPFDAIEAYGAIAVGTENRRVFAGTREGLAICYASYRDFDSAWRCLDEAVAGHPIDAPHWMARATVLLEQDRLDEALAAARVGHDLSPTRAWGVELLAHALRSVGSDGAAEEVLARSLEHCEDYAVSLQLARLRWERGDLGGASVALDRAEALAVLAERPLLDQFRSMRAEIAYARGDVPDAIAHYRRTRAPSLSRLADRLESLTPPVRRVLLEVPFVRQQYKTCSPASLAMLTAYWKQPAAHLEIAAQICYDGTPDHSARRWAEESGWFAREFRVDAASAHAALDRGVPFAMATTEAGAAHMQVVVGYDTARDSLYVRDPFVPGLMDYATGALCTRYAGTGPRALAIVPMAERARIEELDLTDATDFDARYRAHRALARHDRSAAVTELNALEARDPSTLIASHVRWDIAAYDQNYVAEQAVVEGLLQRYPDHEPLHAALIGCLSRLGLRDETRAAIERACERTDGSPAFWAMRAREPVAGGRSAADTVRWMRRVVRRQSRDPGHLHDLGTALWDSGDHEAGLECVRLAACLGLENDPYALAWFRLARQLGRDAHALDWLERRFERLGRADTGPAIALATAQVETGDSAAALATYERANEMRPADGRLLLEWAHELLSVGRIAEARDRLERAQPVAAPAQWHRAAARVAYFDGDVAGCIAHSRAVIEIEPLALDVHAPLAQMLAHEGDPRAGRRHLADVAARFPSHRGLQALTTQALRDGEGNEWLDAARAYVASDAGDAWGHRELACALADQRDQDALDEAIRELDAADAASPRDPHNSAIRAAVLLAAGRTADAHHAALAALHAMPDSTDAAAKCLETSLGRSARADAAREVLDILRARSASGEALHALLGDVSAAGGSQALLEQVSALVRDRPSWLSARVVQTRLQLDVRANDDALASAIATCERFPVATGAWTTRSAVHRARLERDEEAAALERAIALAPAETSIVLRRAYLAEDVGDLAGARAIVDRLIARVPWNGIVREAAATLAIKAGAYDAAREHARLALRLSPRQWGTWQLLNDLCRAAGAPDQARLAAKRLTDERPAHPDGWMARAYLEGDAKTRIEYAEKAVRARPSDAANRDVLAAWLADAKRYDDALALCDAARVAGHLPHDMRGRIAWIRHARGERDDAIAAMRAITDEKPNYLWGWIQLATWLEQADDAAACEMAARAMCAVAPESAAGHKTLAAIARRRGDKIATAAALADACAVAPDDAAAVFQLVEAQLARPDVDAATLALRRYGGVLAKGARVGLEGRIAVARKDHTGARAAFREVAMLQPPAPAAYDSLAAALTDAGWDEDILEVCAPLLAQSGVDDAVGYSWVRAHHRVQNDKILPVILGLPQNDARRTAAYAVLLKHLENKDLEAFQSATAAVGEPVAADGRARAEIMRMLAGIVPTDRAAFSAALDEWKRGWRARTDLSAAELFNLSSAARGAGDEATGRDAIDRALVADPDEPLRSNAFVLALYDAAAARDLRTAREHLGAIERVQVWDFYGVVLAFAEAWAAAWLDTDPPRFNSERAVALYAAAQDLSARRGLTTHPMMVAVDEAVWHSISLSAGGLRRRPKPSPPATQTPGSANWMFWMIAMGLASAIIRQCSGSM